MPGFYNALTRAAAAAGAVQTTPATVPGDIAARTASAEAPVLTAFFPQLLGMDLQASIITVKDDITTAAMCVEGTCDILQWTFAWGESTANIVMTAYEETATIGCDFEMAKDEADCTLTDNWGSSQTVSSIVLSTLTDFVTTFTVTAGASHLTTSSSTSSTPTETATNNLDDVSSTSASTRISRTTAAPSSTGDDSPSATAESNDDGEGDLSNTSSGTSASSVPDDSGAASGLARPLALVAGALIAGAVIAL